MKFVADIHIHSHFSRATSKNLNFEHLTKWAQMKGVHVVGTGDIAHPGWLQEMKEKLVPAEEGLFRLKDEYAKAVQEDVPKACHDTVRFMIGGEISSIYKKNDKVRKIHNVIFAPSFESVEKIQAALEKIGNIRSDGRPILGLDSRDLLEIILEIDPQNYLIPAHIWTPWFSLLGSKSGFDSVEECFEDLTPHIFAVETGLSSDPPMNWRVSELDRYTLVSNSDAHSPPKLAREANQFDTELSYPAIFDALKTGDPTKFLGTIEFFPEEGKYHYDGHRKCDVSWHPQTTLAQNGLCSQCGKPVTIGVMHRVEALADRPEEEAPGRPHTYTCLIPLPEILSEIHSVGPNSKRVTRHYETLLGQLGSELSILQDIPLEEIERADNALLAEGIRRMRQGEVSAVAGYDGEYGVIKVFDGQEKESLSPQLTLFEASAKQTPSSKRSTPKAPSPSKPRSKSQLSVNGTECFQNGRHVQPSMQPSRSSKSQHEIKQTIAKHQPSYDADTILAGLNPQQKEAALYIDRPLIVVAGPGTGKTRTLTHRIAYLVMEKKVDPERILAITFTNKASEEMVERLSALLGNDVAKRIVVKTFHAFGAMILHEMGEHTGLNPNFSICSEQDRRVLLKQCQAELSEREINQTLDEISTAKNQLLTPGSPKLAELHEAAFVEQFRSYEVALKKNQMVDFDDLILRPVRLFESMPEILQTYQQRFHWISVDEYQDVNLAQYRLLRLLTKPDNTEIPESAPNLCVIGDPDQAIYGFRGANREYFLSFHQDFPTAQTLQLEQNYRSTQLILDASSQVIAQDNERTAIKIWSDFIDKTRLDIYQASTDKAEAEYVVHQIEQMVGGTSYFSLDSGRVDDRDEDGGPTARSFGDFAVLYRLGAQSQLLHEAFARSGIPYQAVGQIALYDHKEIQEILAYLWFMSNTHSMLHLDTILNRQQSASRGKQLEQLSLLAEEQNISLWTLVQSFERQSWWSTSQKKQLRAIIPFLNDLNVASNTQSVATLLEQTHQFIQHHYDIQTDERHDERVQQLILSAAPFEDRLGDFLQSTALKKEPDFYDARSDRVTLMTLHASKGLEFPVIFVVGCEEGILPYQRVGKSFDLGEERRLFYVGMTRAQQKLILTHAKRRFLFGERLQNEPSRFVDDIESTLKAIKEMTARRPDKQKAKPKAEELQLKLF